MTSSGQRSVSRWRYAKRIDHLSGEIVSLYRVRGLDVQILRDGKWEAANYRRWFDIIEDPEFEWLSGQEASNLNNYLRCGQTEIPKRLDLEPALRYKKWKCPNCQTFTVVPAVVGLPGADLMEAERDGHVVLHGCTVFGDQSERPVACTECHWQGEHLRGKTLRQNP